MASAGDTLAPELSGVPPAPLQRRRAPRGLVALSVGIALAFAAPFVYLVLRSLAAPADLWATLSGATALAPLGRTLVLGGAVSISAAVLGTAAAFLVARTDLPGRRLVGVLLPLPLVIPSFVAATSLLAAFAPSGLLGKALRPFGVERLPAIEGFWGTFAMLTLITYPYVYLPAAARLRQLPPSVEEAARLLGRRPAAVFATIVVPQSRSAILAGTLLVFLYTISDFGAVQLLRYDTLTRVIYATRLDSQTSLALSLLLGVLAIVVVAAERALIRGPRMGDVNRALRGLRVSLGRWRYPAIGFVAALVGLSLVAPVGVLCFWAVRGLVRGSTRGSAFVADIGQLAGPAANTALVSIAAAAIAVVAVLPVAYLTVRHRSRSGGAAYAVIVGGFALPGLALALALVFWAIPTPLYQTLPLLVFAYLVHFGAHALRAAQVAVASVPRRLEDSARALGAPRLRRLFTVELPLMSPGLMAGAGLVLLSTMKELPLTLLLAPAGFDTLARKIWTAAEDAFFADASLASLLLIATSGVLTWLLVARRAEMLE